MKRKPIAGLAGALAELAATEETATTRADSVLAIVRGAGIRTAAAFNQAVRDAYKANGWHTAQGRPSGGIRAATVPVTVKQYVSHVRAAFRLKIGLGHFKSFYALRQAVAKARAAAAKPRVARDPKLAGLTLVKSGTLIGAPFHDLTVLYEKSNRQMRGRLLAKVTDILREFKPTVAPVLELRRAA